MAEYVRWIEEQLHLVNKEGREVPFILNPIQRRYLTHDVPQGTPHIVLKARQQGFSSVILARFLADFLYKDNSRSVVVADIAENATTLLQRLKFYLASYERKNGITIPLKYNSKSELVNALNGAVYTIGTAKNAEFGRSQTITNLHLSEAAFYPNLQAIVAGAGNAVVPGGYFVMETTANGFDRFKTMWDEAVSGQNGFIPLFYKASDFYDPAFLAEKKKQQGRTFSQEYPETPVEAFLTSGDPYFSTDALQWYNQIVKHPLHVQSVR